MKKINKKTFVVGLAAIAIAVGAAVNVGLFPQRSKYNSDLSLANVEALAQIIPESYGFNYVMYKDKCTFEINTLFELKMIKKLPKFGGVSLGTTVDLSDGTQLFREKKAWESGVRLGADITCNKFLDQLGVI